MPLLGNELAKKIGEADKLPYRKVCRRRRARRRSRLAGGDYIYFLALEDLEGVVDVVILGEVYRRNRPALSGPGPYLVEGVVELDEEKGEPFIRAERLEVLGI